MSSLRWAAGSPRSGICSAAVCPVESGSSNTVIRATLVPTEEVERELEELLVNASKTRANLLESALGLREPCGVDLRLGLTVADAVGQDRRELGALVLGERHRGLQDALR